MLFSSQRLVSSSVGRASQSSWLNYVLASSRASWIIIIKSFAADESLKLLDLLHIELKLVSSDKFAGSAIVLKVLDSAINFAIMPECSADYFWYND